MPLFLSESCIVYNVNKKKTLLYHVALIIHD